MEISLRSVHRIVICVGICINMKVGNGEDPWGRERVVKWHFPLMSYIPLAGLKFRGVLI